MAAQRSANRPDRRRNHRLRRLVDCAYGLSLCLAASHALAAAPARPPVQSSPHVQPQAPRLVLLGLDHWMGTDEQLQDFLRAPLSAEPVLRNRFLQALDELDVENLAFERQPLKRIKYGLAFDYLLPQGGALHLSLYHRPQAKREGLRLSLNPLDRKHGELQRNWSFGVSSDFIRTAQGQRRIGMKPQLLLDLDQLLQLQELRWLDKF